MCPQYIASDRVRAIAVKGLSQKARVRPFMDGQHSRTVEWDVAGKCQSPVTVLLHGRRELKNERYSVVNMHDPNSKPTFVEVIAPCRMCDACLRKRAAMWRYRALAEYEHSARTWFATLTMSPASVMHILSRVRVSLSKQGIDLDTLPADKQFAALADAGYRDVQLWLKRLRKKGHVFRYFAVTEAHKSGVPHWHVLLHECDKESPMRYDGCLKGSWHLGFDSYKLLHDGKACAYATKYLHKQSGARVRASLLYGVERTPRAA